MAKSEHILNELNELQSSLGAAGHPGYSVPGGYFEGLAAEILKRVKALESANAKEELENLSPLLSGISKKMPFAMPQGYFDELSKNLAAGPVANESDPAQEIEELSPLLSSLRNKTTYQAPAGYFENLSTRIIEKINGAETKIISITSRKWFRYAAAAVVIGFVAMMGFLFLGRNEGDTGTTSYAWVKKNLKKVSTDDINDFVELASQESTDVVKLDTRNEINSLLKDISDKEIQDFLNDTQVAETGSDEDLILN